MRIEHLVAHGISAQVVGRWQSVYGRDLLPLQEKALVDTGLMRGSNLVVFAPTSSGKTLVAEMAAVKQVAGGRKAVFLVPTKALAEEQHAHLSRVYGPLGMKCVVATRERTRDDGAIAAGRFDLAVVVYEKFKAFTTAAPQLLGRVGLVAVDELQLLGDPERGGAADLLLTRLLTSPAAPQVVALSAVLGENSRLGSWLDADFLVWRQRPVELREGVVALDDGMFRFREFNSGREDAEPLIAPESTLAAPDQLEFPGVQATVQELVRRGDQVLVFVPSRHLCRQWAYQLSRSLEKPGDTRAAGDLIGKLADHEESHSREILAQCFERAVGLHNADLPLDLRQLVEDGFRSGAIRVLVATSTLAQGVNLACRNVISVPTMVGEDPVTGKTGFVPLSRQRLRNQGGRAGRLSSGEPFGRSILVAPDGSEAGRLAREYVLADPEPLDPPIRPNDLDRQALDAIASRRAGDRDSLRELMLRTYTGTILWAAAPEQLNLQMDRALAHLAEAGLTARGDDGRIEATGLGEAAAAFGIQVATARDFATWCNARRAAEEEPGWQGHFPPVSAFEVLAMCAFSRDGELFPLPLTSQEKDTRHYARELAARTDLKPEALPPPLRDRLTVYGGLNEAGQVALKKTFIGEFWISAAPTPDVEESYRTFAGTVANLAGHLSWLAQALAACALALGVDPETCEAVGGIGARLPEGVLPQGLPLARLEVTGLTRSYIADLVREGFETPQSVADAPDEVLARIIPARLRGRLREAALRETRERGEERGLPSLWKSLRPSPATETDPGEPASPLLVLSGKHPGQVRFRGREVLMTNLPFDLLLLLARHPGQVVSYEAIDGALWPDAKVEQQQILAHRRAIVECLAAAAPGAGPELVRVVKGRGLMLALGADEVRIG